MSTGGRGGQLLKKTIGVITNDPKNREIPLHLKAQVDKIYTVTPRSFALKGIEGEAITQTVTLIPNESFPFTLKEISAKRGQYIKYRFEEVKVGESVRYNVTVENTRKDAGVYFDTLYLKTDSKRNPQIAITVFGSIGKAPDQPA